MLRYSIIFHCAETLFKQFEPFMIKLEYVSLSVKPLFEFLVAYFKGILPFLLFPLWCVNLRTSYMCFFFFFRFRSILCRPRLLCLQRLPVACMWLCLGIHRDRPYEIKLGVLLACSTNVHNLIRRARVGDARDGLLPLPGAKKEVYIILYRVFFELMRKKLKRSLGKALESY